MKPRARGWPTIAAAIPGRTGKQCRERWPNQLDPAVSKAPYGRRGPYDPGQHHKPGNRGPNRGDAARPDGQRRKNYWNGPSKGASSTVAGGGPGPSNSNRLAARGRARGPGRRRRPLTCGPLLEKAVAAYGTCPLGETRSPPAVVAAASTVAPIRTRAGAEGDFRAGRRDPSHKRRAERRARGGRQACWKECRGSPRPKRQVEQPRCSQPRVRRP